MFGLIASATACRMAIIQNSKRKESEEKNMKTVIIEYEKISPVVLINKIEKAFPGAIARFTDIDEDYFELSVFGCTDLEMLEDILAEYV